MGALCPQSSKLQRLGGKIHSPPADIPNIGRYAVVADPQGAIFNLFYDQWHCLGWKVQQSRGDRRAVLNFRSCPSLLAPMIAHGIYNTAVFVYQLRM
jgi:hypothetical protein